MQVSQREVTLKITSRPLRIVYLIRNREDLINAVTLYTHVWGGAANAILPLPENDEEQEAFKLSLEWINPDYIFYPTEGIPSYAVQVLEKSPALQSPISEIAIKQHVNTNFLPSLSGVKLPQMGLILNRLYPNGSDKNNIRLVEAGGDFNFAILLQSGNPIQWYQDYLVKQLGAKVFNPPNTVEQLIKESLLLAQLESSASLTMRNTKNTWSPLSHYITWTQDVETLCLFLDDDHDIGVATAFWNSCRILRNNKIFLPREAFLANIEHHASLIIEFMPSVRALLVTTPLEREEALDLCSSLKQAFATAGKEVSVKVFYRDFRFDWIHASIYYGGTNEFSRVMNSDSSIRFEPPIPFGHENTNYSFAYDAEVRFATNRRFVMPSTLQSSLLLTNELKIIEWAEQNQDNLEKQYLRQKLSVRSAAKGITGIAQSGKECRFHIHSDDIIITRRLKDAGFEVRLNHQTLYAKGFIKRFGGFENAIHIMNKQAADIISACVYHEGKEKREEKQKPREKQGGLYRSGIESFLVKQRGMAQEEADKLLQENLQSVLENGLIRRGYSPRCPTCNLKEWYSLEEVNEFIECRGCAENFLLPLNGIEFTYKSNELVARLVKEGGLAVLMTASLFHYIIQHPGFIQFGGELLYPGEKQNFVDVDLFWLTDGAFVIAECKSYYEINEDNLPEIKNSLEKTVEVAKKIDAQIVILGLVTHSSNLSEVFALIKETSDKAKESGIGVHLALNGKLHIWGSPDETEPWKVQLEELQVNRDPQQQEWYVGESPQLYRDFGGSRTSYEPDVLSCWDQEIRKK